MQESGLLSSVMSSAIVHRDASPFVLQEKVGKRDRGVGVSNASRELKVSFTLEEVAALEPGKGVHKWCGLVGGYPARLQVEWKTAKDVLGAFLGIYMENADLVSDDPLDAGVGLKHKMTLSPDVQKQEEKFFSHRGKGHADIFDKPWAEAVREGSPHFLGGTLEFKATVALAQAK